MYTRFRCAESPEHVAKTNTSSEWIKQLTRIKNGWAEELAGIKPIAAYAPKGGWPKTEQNYDLKVVLIERDEYDYMMKPIPLDISQADLHDYGHNLAEIKVRAFDRAIALGLTTYQLHITTMERWRAVNNTCKVGATH